MDNWQLNQVSSAVRDDVPVVARDNTGSVYELAEITLQTDGRAPQLIIELGPPRMEGDDAEDER